MPGGSYECMGAKEVGHRACYSELTSSQCAAASASGHGDQCLSHSSQRLGAHGRLSLLSAQRESAMTIRDANLKDNMMSCHGSQTGILGGV
jgi:hypothetical protein